MQPTTKSILLIVPSYDGNMHAETEKALELLDIPEGYVMERRVISRNLITAARNKAVRETIIGNFDYLLFCDDDVVPKPDALKLMLQADKHIVTGCVRRRGYPHHLAIFKEKPDPLTHFSDFESYPNLPEGVDDVFEVYNCGTGFVLYKADMLHTAYEAYDYVPFDDKLAFFVPMLTGERVEFERAYDNPLLRKTRTGEINLVKMYISEDLLFHYRCRLAGFKTYAHRLVLCDHYDGDVCYRVEDLV